VPDAIRYYYDQATSSNPNGRLTKATDASGQTVFHYDKRGRVTKTVKTVDAVNYTTSFTYDGISRITSVKYPGTSPETVSYVYNGDMLSQVIGSNPAPYAAYTNYNALGQPGTVTYGNNVTTAYQYSPTNNRLQSITTNSASQTLLNLSYTYDNTGNVTGIADAIDSTRSQAFIYDDLNRLWQAQSTAYGTQFYAYDQIGNITSKEGVSYTYAGIGPHAVSLTSDGKTYAYDPDGNMMFDGTRSFFYNSDNMPRSIIMAGKTTSFVYDYANQRTKKTTPTGTNVYIGKLYECRSNVCTKYIFAGNQLIAHKSGSIVDYYHQDHLGSSRIVTDVTGTKIEDAYYYPFGAAKTDTGSVSVTHKYTSQEFDTETGLYNYNARLYNPTLGRFTSADTIVPSPFNPQSLNRYSYVMNNPLRYTDPSGHLAVSFGYFAGGAYGGPGAEGSYDFNRGRGSIGVGWGNGGGGSVQSGNTSIGYTQPGSWNIQYGYDSFAHSEYASTSYNAKIANFGVGVSGKYYFRNYEYQVGANAGYKNIGVSVGHSRYGGNSVGVGVLQANATYNYGTKSWSYGYTVDPEALESTYEDVVKNRQDNGYGPQGGEQDPFYRCIDWLGTVMAGYQASDNHDAGYGTLGANKPTVDFGLFTDMMVGSISNAFQTNGLFRTAVGLALSPLYYSAVVVGGGAAFYAGQENALIDHH